MKITIGCDPEVFLQHVETGESVPVTGLVGGTKWHPRPCKDGALQEDNVMAEFNITPAENENQFVNNINSVMGQLNAILTPLKLKTVVASSMKFTQEQLNTPHAKEFGCDPDFNIYTFDHNEVNRMELEQACMRVAGGHIHIGIAGEDGKFGLEDNPQGRMILAKACEMYIGVPSAMLDDDILRKKFYGKAGSIRWKSYGVEYRTPSNFWLKNEKRMRWMYNQACYAARRAIQLPERVNQMFDEHRDRIQEAVDTKNKKLCTQLARAIGDIRLPTSKEVS
jgi:hypothetical protein